MHKHNANKLQTCVVINHLNCAEYLILYTLVYSQFTVKRQQIILVGNVTTLKYYVGGQSETGRSKIHYLQTKKVISCYLNIKIKSW